MEKNIKIGYNGNIKNVFKARGKTIEDYIKKQDVFKREYGFKSAEYDVLVTTSMGAGGKALVLCSPLNEDEVKACMRAAKAAELPVFVCGKLSNTIIKDGGFNGVMLRIGENYSGYEIDGENVIAKAGTSLISLAKDVTEKKLGGLEFAGGIPGCLGGAVRMNAGAYGGQMSDVVTGVTYFDGEKIVTTESIGFGYRESAFDNMENVVILSVRMRLKQGEGDVELLKEYNRRRREKQPLDKPSCGSVFKRPKDGFASKLVDECGLKGLKVGGAVVSEKHGGFIVNDKGATSADCIELMEQVRAEVYKQKGILLENEWKIIGED